MAIPGRLRAKLGKNTRRILDRFGYTLLRKQRGAEEYVIYRPSRDMDNAFIPIYEKVKELSMTRVDALYALYESIRYIEKAGIVGDVVECGVWRGGSCLMVAETLYDLKSLERKIYLYDTFEGMTRPGPLDKRWDGQDSLEKWQQAQELTHNKWAYSPLEDVKRNLGLSKYPQSNYVFVKGPVDETLSKVLPTHIALLRLILS